MGLIHKVLGRLMFWRKQTVTGEFDVDGCFTLPGADLDDMARHGGATAEACAVETDAAGAAKPAVDPSTA